MQEIGHELGRLTRGREEPESRQLGPCPVCDEAVSLDDNFASWGGFVTHLSCAFSLTESADELLEQQRYQRSEAA